MDKLFYLQVPQRISLPASHLLNSLASTVRPSFMTALEKIQKLFHDVSSGALSEMPLEVHCIVHFPIYNQIMSLRFFLNKINSFNHDPQKSRASNLKPYIPFISCACREQREVPIFLVVSLPKIFLTFWLGNLFVLFFFLFVYIQIVFQLG